MTNNLTADSFNDWVKTRHAMQERVYKRFGLMQRHLSSISPSATVVEWDINVMGDTPRIILTLSDPIRTSVRGKVALPAEVLWVPADELEDYLKKLNLTL